MSIWKVTTLDKFIAAKRELRLRQQVYPRWIAAGKMSPRTADHQIAVMEAIVDDYYQQVKADEAVERQKQKSFL